MQITADTLAALAGRPINGNTRLVLAGLVQAGVGGRAEPAAPQPQSPCRPWSPAVCHPADQRRHQRAGRPAGALCPRRSRHARRDPRPAGAAAAGVVRHRPAGPGADRQAGTLRATPVPLSLSFTSSVWLLSVSDANPMIDTIQNILQPVPAEYLVSVVLGAIGGFLRFLPVKWLVEVEARHR